MLCKYWKYIVVSVVSLVTVTQFALAGDSRGGGDALKEGHGDPALIRKTILEIGSPLKAFFNFLEFASDHYDDFGKAPEGIPGKIVFDKLFHAPNGRTIFDEFKSVKFVPKPKGPCKDLDQKDVDASAFNSAPDEICFSLERLSEKVGQYSMTLQITALAAHEISHRVGTTEVEAEALQTLAIEVLSNKSNKDLASVSERFIFSLNSLHNEVKATLFALESEAVTLDVCSKVTTVMNSADALVSTYMEIANHYGMHLLRNEGMNQIWGLKFKTMVDHFYCLEEDDLTKVVLKQNFSGQSQTSLREFMKKLYANTTPTSPNSHMLNIDPGEGILRYIKFEDSVTLKAELSDVLAVIEKLMTELGAKPEGKSDSGYTSDFAKQMNRVKAAQRRLMESVKNSKILPKEISCPNLKVSMKGNSLYSVEMASFSGSAKKWEDMECQFTEKNPVIFMCREKSGREYLNSLEVRPLSWVNGLKNSQADYLSANFLEFGDNKSGSRGYFTTFPPESCKVTP